jgi:hypothetical protein
MVNAQNISIKMIRTARCADDPRINKMIYHYGKLGIILDIHCFSRSTKCKRISTDNIKHRTTNLLNYSILNRLPRLARQIIIRIEYLISILLLSSELNSKFKAIHCCDLDGYLLGIKAAKLRNNKYIKSIFEIYDPWQTMTGKEKILTIENKAIENCDLLIMPSKDGRIKPNKQNQIYMTNAVDIEIANDAMKIAQKKLTNELIEILNSEYIIVGGTVSKDIKINELLEVARKNNLKVVLACNKDKIDCIDKEYLNDITYTGVLDWGTWLILLKKALAAWVFYDESNFHYQSHISPNKYWEAALLNVPMFISSKEQFCDRVSTEPMLIPLKEDFNKNFNSGVTTIRASRNYSEIDEEGFVFWEKMSKSRTKSLEMGLQAIGVIK